MRANRVKRTLQAGGVSIGTMVFEFSSTGIGRIAAAAGADFVLYDLEHTGWSIETIRLLLATTRAAETIPLVRVPASDYHLIARPLDLGAMGIMVPMVESAAQAARIAAAVRYPPLGRRGAAFGVAHDDYEGGDISAKMASANEELLLIAQIETAAGLEQVEAIAATAGVDCLWIGHFDLTNALGIPGQFAHPTYRAAVDRVLAACRSHGKIAGIMAGDVETGRTLLAQGFRAVAYSGDVWIYGQALREGIAALRAAAGHERT
ncbi:MAG TPA: aldolase/citrate lyase family protein [Thermomicrobiales bacterium]|nr:aldolase/citrate lyase family protein [Thermomicrobiales bacterium]